jgi:hypothetical protein
LTRERIKALVGSNGGGSRSPVHLASVSGNYTLTSIPERVRFNPPQRFSPFSPDLFSDSSKVFKSFFLRLVDPSRLSDDLSYLFQSP